MMKELFDWETWKILAVGGTGFAVQWATFDQLVKSLIGIVTLIYLIYKLIRLVRSKPGPE